MKLDGKSHTEILDYLSENDVHRMTKITRKDKVSRRIDPSLNGLKTMFEDPFYYGLLIQSGQEVNLIEVTDGAFQPMISYDEYIAVQGMGGGKSRRVKKRAKFLPLRGLVKCEVCGCMMTPGVSGGHGGQYLFIIDATTRIVLEPLVVYVPMLSSTLYLMLLEVSALLRRSIRYTAIR